MNYQFYFVVLEPVSKVLSLQPLIFLYCEQKLLACIILAQSHWKIKFSESKREWKDFVK